MTMITPQTPAVIVRSAAAETLGNPDQPPAVRLIADSLCHRRRAFFASFGADPDLAEHAEEILAAELGR
jgi:hypothetical protein